MKRKRISKWLVMLSMAVLYTVSTLGATISDVSTSHWAYTAIKDIEERGIMAVNSKGQFLPNETMNYFEVADVLAKATGYVDVEVNKNVDEAFKTQIINNYNAQKTTLAKYAAKYSAWDKLYDQQVAYLLGRGYISTTDLDKFITKASDGKEAKAVISKQDLAVLVVRMLGKETTAKTNYKSTGFTDESLILEANRPHVAYLKSLNLVSGDVNGAFGANTKVTKATCAKMVSDALKYKESQSSGTNTGTDTNTNTAETVTVKKILTKNTSEYYILLEKGTNTSYYTIKNTTQITDKNGNQIAITEVPLESTGVVQITLENNTEYITSMKLTDAITGGGEATTPTPGQVTTINGTLTEASTNSIVRITLTDGSIKAYILDPNCIVTLDGKAVSADEIAVGDKLVATLQNSSITKLVATTTNTGNISVASEGEVKAKTLTTKGYTLTVIKGSKEVEVVVPSAAKITRNNKTRDIEDIRIGDKVQFTEEAGVVTAVVATGTQSVVEGTISAIYIAQKPQITVKTDKQTVTYTMAEDAEYYDNNERTSINIRDLHLGQTVDLILESKEVVSLEVQKGSAGVSYKATINSIGKGYEYIDVIVDYDPISGASRIAKRIKTPIELKILLGSIEEHRSIFKEGMEIVVTYKYLDDFTPEKILIIE